MKTKVVSIVIALVLLAVLAVSTQATGKFVIEAPGVFFFANDSFQREVSIEVRGEEQTFTDIMPGDYGTIQFVIVNTGLVDVGLAVYFEANGDLFAHPSPIELTPVFVDGNILPIGQEVALLVHWSMPEDASDWYEGGSGQLDAYITAYPTE